MEKEFLCKFGKGENPRKREYQIKLIELINEGIRTGF